MLTRDGTAEPVSRDQLLRSERGQGNINFPCSADHEYDWQPYLVGCSPVRGLLDRKRSYKYLQSSNESIIIKANDKENPKSRQNPLIVGVLYLN